MSPKERIPDIASIVGRYALDMPPEQQILGLFAAKWAIGGLRAVVELTIPDRLADGPRTADELAAAVGAKPDILYRVMRGLAAAGVFSEREDRAFGLTPISAALRSDAVAGFRDMFLFASDPMLWRPYENIAHTIRTGVPSFTHAFGASFYDYIRENPASSAVFDRAMQQNHYPGTDRIFDEFDFGRFTRIADVGGGHGQFLAEVLTRYPGCSGVLCDQPQVVSEAKRLFEERGVADRVKVVSTDFFTAIEKGCDAYFVKHTLHNWDDADAARILRRIREAIDDNEDARLLIVDMVLTGPGTWDIGKLIDIEALSVLGGRERSRDEWDRLAGAAGFLPANDPVVGDLAILEYRPCEPGLGVPEAPA
ncbi:methyltransferase [Amycolatopsis sp. NPDC059021]|uniref:methyltransferase n=1 Tax=Amycolatopsis sp. NPDC059021 TaxID=3346704 RepID=UPI00366C2FC4